MAMIFAGIGLAVGVPDGILAVAMFAIFFGVPVLVYYRVERTRDRKYAEVLGAMGFTRFKDSNDDFRYELEVFPTFSRRSHDCLKNHFRTSREGVELSIFDFHFAHVPAVPGLTWFLLLFQPLIALLCIRLRAHTVVLCRSARMILPHFFLHLRRVVRTEGTPVADLGEEVLMPPEFFKEYSLKGVDPERTRDVFSPEVTSYLLQQKDLHVEGIDDTLIVYRPGRLLDAKKIKPFLDEVIALLGMFEAAARRDQIRNGGRVRYAEV
ncbi:MAG: hypothetical protein JW741_12645 [Sedimentisphaerales bacterium]|nr:hypothetical protein [Sedimentisphaerales bacterium]